MSWWSNISTHAYANKLQCIISQYNKYVIDKLEKHMDGKLTADENMADNAGLKMAYDTYSKNRQNYNAHMI